ncbi:MAG: dihydrofolate reductase [Saprospiraceae bacterium]|nr:dihydrofolate reductase [Saprospiraceae bacterium]
MISAIVATAKNGVIGKDNEIPWYLPADFAYFKRTTLNHHIIMGRNCFESIGRPLPKRTNIVITRNPFYIASGCLMVHSITEGVKMAKKNGETEAFIIGGGEIYAQSIDLWDKLYLTEVDLDTEGDVFFPELDMSEWRLVSEEYHTKDEKNEYDYCFKVYERI